MTRITLDPLTRIEGHLRLTTEVQNNRVVSARSSARTWPGFALVLKGRDPLEAWAYAQRFCGVCTTVHAVTSIRAVEQALGVNIPLNAQYYRNCLMAQHSLYEHILHFYGRSLLDWVDTSPACRANPEATTRLSRSQSDVADQSCEYFTAVQEKLKCLTAGRTADSFASRYSGHPAMQLSPESNLLLASHYMTSFEYSRKAAHLLDLLQGKTPGNSNLKNLLAGGVAAEALLPDRLAELRLLMEEIRRFVHDFFLPDMLTIAAAYPEWFGYGGGVTTYLSAPEFPDGIECSSFALNGGMIVNGDNETFQQFNNHSDSGLRGFFSTQRSLAVPEKGPVTFDNTTNSFDGGSLQTGPLAQVLAASLAGNRRVKPLVMSISDKLGIGLNDFHSTMGRNLARAIRAQVLADLSLDYLDRIMENRESGDLCSAVNVEIPAGEFSGTGFHEASRGILFHGVVIRDGLISDYDVTAPSTWNAASSSLTGSDGPYEAALINHPVSLAEKPLELLRTMRSFDPCIACAVHVQDFSGREVSRFDVL